MGYGGIRANDKFQLTAWKKQQKILGKWYGSDVESLFSMKHSTLLKKILKIENQGVHTEFENSFQGANKPYMWKSTILSWKYNIHVCLKLYSHYH